jgi:hypothetical protein
MFLPAVRLLVASLRSLYGVECIEVGALDIIRQRLNEVKEVCFTEYAFHDSMNNIIIVTS